MTFFQITAVNIWSMTIDIIFLIWISGFLFGRIPRRGMKHAVVCILAGTGIVILLSFTGTVCYLTGVWRWKYSIGAILWLYFILACKVLFLWLLYRVSLWDCCLEIMLIEILGSYGKLLAELYTCIFGKDFYDLAVPEERRSYLFWLTVVCPACILFCGLVIDRSGMGKIYRKWLEQEEKHRGIVFLLAFYPVIYLIFEKTISGARPKAAFILLPLSMLLVVHIIFIYMGRDWQQKQYIMAQQTSLRQQTIYLEKMEQIQSDLRKFRHDFQNMMAGMYLQAKAGDLAAIQDFIQEVTGAFDRQAGDQIKLMTQLGIIHVMEVKSILLEKLIEMQQEEIVCVLEVLSPFENTRMRSIDLCRCLGILMDNAMEEVRGKKDGRIYLMISSQNGCTTFRIENTLYGTVDFQRLGKPGYTTKGSGRGTGLESYREILDKYDFVFSFTAIQDGCFVQEIKIEES